MRAQGFSLLEVMISSFILAIGILGLAGMQSVAVKSVTEVQQRTLANSLLVDITERMQLNNVWLTNSANDYATPSLQAAQLRAPPCVTDGTFSNCTGEQIKQNDLFEWRQKLLAAHVNNNSAHGLIDADACISAPDEKGKITVVLSWLSTLKSSDAAANASPSSIYATCGTSGKYRRQISVQSFISQS